MTRLGAPPDQFGPPHSHQFVEPDLIVQAAIDKNAISILVQFYVGQARRRALSGAE
jgi:hypothetical protein